MHITDLDIDVLINILSFLPPWQLLVIRKTCKRLSALTYLHIVWTNACTYYVLKQGYPFPKVPLDRLSTTDLEQYTCRAFHLAKKWLSGNWSPRRKWFIDAATNTSITDIRLLPGSRGTLLLALSRTLWSAIAVWQLGHTTSGNGPDYPDYTKLCEWSPRGAIFNGFAVNSDPASETKVAVSVLINGEQTIQLLSLIECPIEERRRQLKSILSFTSTYKPITLQGDLLALSDDICETIIFNWKTSDYAILQHNHENQEILQYNKCIQVIFAYQSILVARARSIHLFPDPLLKAVEEGPILYSPVAQYSFGWVDGISLQSTGRTCNTPASSGLRPLSILLRAELDDPWASDILGLELYTLQPDPSYVPVDPRDTTEERQSPYIFPPMLTSKVRSVRGALRCTNVILGSSGTAIWIQPRDRSATGLWWSMDDSLPGYVRAENINESLIAIAFPGPLKPGGTSHTLLSDNDVLEGHRICWNELNNWTSIDYDEDIGRIVLGSSFGRITTLDL